MANAKKQGQRLMPEYLLKYTEKLENKHPDPEADWGGGGGSSYRAGTGIDITNDVISIDSTVVTTSDLATELLDYAELSDLATVATTGSYNDLSNKPDLSDYAKLNDDTQNITASTITVTPGSGYIHTTYGPTTIAMSIPRTPGYTITIPTKDGTMALTSDIPSLTGYATESWVTNQGYSTFSGDYNDLSNKPTIPDAVSGTNDGANWTSLTIGSDTYGIPSGGGSGTTVSGTNDGTNWTSLTIGSDTYGIPSGGSGSGPTITRYDTSSYMSYTNWTASDRSCPIWDGYPDSNEFRIENTNPGDILFIDVSLDYYIKNSEGEASFHKRYTFKTVVPIKSPEYDNSHKSLAYELYELGKRNYADGFLTLEIANITGTAPNRLQIGTIYIPSAPTTDSRNTVTVNFITHIAF